MVPAAQQPGDELWDPSWEACQGEQTILDRSSDSAAITLFCSWFCPFAQRAWIALEEKQVSYQYIEVNPYEVDLAAPGGYTKKQLPLEEKRRLYPDFIAASPRGLVPAITHIRQHVWESLHVVEYIDTVFSSAAPLGPPPHPSPGIHVARDSKNQNLVADGGDRLVPEHDALKQAHVRIWADHCTERIQKAYYAALMIQNPSEQKESLERFYEECRMLARAMSPEQNGPFFLGETFSLVDVALAPFWQRFVIVGGHYRGLKFPDKEPEFRRLRVWWNAVKMRPSVAATFVCPERLIASYAQYANNQATSDFAQVMSSVISSANAASVVRPDGAGSSRALDAPPSARVAGSSAARAATGASQMTVPARQPTRTAAGLAKGTSKASGWGFRLRPVATFALGAASTVLLQKVKCRK